jgi:hypothetical protein
MRPALAAMQPPNSRTALSSLAWEPLGSLSSVLHCLQRVVERGVGLPLRLHSDVFRSRFRTHHRMAQRFRAGRVFLAGDVQDQPQHAPQEVIGSQGSGRDQLGPTVSVPAAGEQVPLEVSSEFSSPAAPGQRWSRLLRLHCSGWAAAVAAGDSAPRKAGHADTCAR